MAQYTQHVILCGDSALNNKNVTGFDPETELSIEGELNRALGDESRAIVRVLATPGHCMKDFTQTQLPQVPAMATHIFLSIGGNDALAKAKELFEQPGKISLLLGFIHWLFFLFSLEYYQTLSTLKTIGKSQVFICTLYTPDMKKAFWWKRWLCAFALWHLNRVIRTVAHQFNYDILDLAVICDPKTDMRPGHEVELNHGGCKKVAAAMYNKVYPLL